VIALPCFLLQILFHLLTTHHISCPSLNVELLIACLCNHNHLTSIKLSSGDLTSRNTNFILGPCLDISSFTFFDLCIERLSSTKIFWIFPSYQFLFLLESRQTVSLTSFYNIVHAFCHLYSHMLQTHLKYFIF
jgi:hypothetical protein